MQLTTVDWSLEQETQRHRELERQWAKCECGCESDTAGPHQFNALNSHLSWVRAVATLRKYARNSSVLRGCDACHVVPDSSENEARILYPGVCVCVSYVCVHMKR